MPEQEFEYDKLCFVIMPFGKKKVTRPSKRPGSAKRTITETVDFDAIYKNIFKPAIDGIPLPEGGKLIARRADDDLMSGIISREMYRYIEYSRFAIADITSLGANVFLELGQRYRAREAGTAVFRQTDATIPFDINQVRALPYEYAPRDRALESRKLIRKVLKQSLVYNRLDSPVWEALGKQQTGTNVDDELRTADDRIAHQDWTTAEQLLKKALKKQPTNALLHFRIGLMFRDQGRWDEAIESFSSATRLLPDHSDSHRELGIAQSLRFKESQRQPDGIAELERAVAMAPRDYDALASLGGALNRAGKPREALDHYRRAVDVSLGHPYPLLNVMRLETIVDGKPAGGPDREIQLKRAERFRRGQAEHAPPIDTPWSFFDLALIQLYLGRPAESLRLVDEGLLCCSQRWQARTFRESLEALTSARVTESDLSTGLQQMTQRLRQAEPQLPA
jgi:tetratricopeptide (TPR) repeat protein